MGKEPAKNAASVKIKNAAANSAFLGLRVPPGTKKKLEHQAADNGVSMTEWCGRVLSEAVGKAPSPNAAVVEGTLLQEGVRNVADELKRLEKRYAELYARHSKEHDGSFLKWVASDNWPLQSSDELKSIAEIQQCMDRINALRSKNAE